MEGFGPPINIADRDDEPKQPQGDEKKGADEQDKEVGGAYRSGRLTE